MAQPKTGGNMISLNKGLSREIMMYLHWINALQYIRHQSIHGMET